LVATPPRPPVRVLSATLVLAAGLAFGPGATSGVIGPSTATPTPDPRLTSSGFPTPPPPRDAPPRPVQVSVSQDEELRRREQLMRSPDFPRGTPFAYGPGTRGVTVTVKGRAIKLPDDAYVVRVIITI
jgi:hypothetical protein